VSSSRFFSQSNCNPKSPAGTGNSGGVTKRRIGYYEGWAISSDNRKCDSYPPENIAVESLTHSELFALSRDRSFLNSCVC
jgi:GH18 family chitinase